MAGDGGSGKKGGTKGSRKPAKGSVQVAMRRVAVKNRLTGKTGYVQMMQKGAGAIRRGGSQGAKMARKAPRG